MLSVFVCVEIRPTCPPLTHPPSQLSVAETSTKEFINGKWVTIDADFAKYDSFEQSITAHAGFFIRNKRYSKALQSTGKPDEFCREIRKAGYATDPDYADTLIAYNRPHRAHNPAHNLGRKPRPGSFRAGDRFAAAARQERKYRRRPFHLARRFSRRRWTIDRTVPARVAARNLFLAAWSIKI